MRLTLPDVLAALARLERVYKRPAHMTTDGTVHGQAYLDVLAPLTCEQLDGAVRAYLRDSQRRYYPKPAELYALAVAERRAGATARADTLEERYLAWEHAGYSDPETGAWVPCPVCGAAVPASGRIEVRHDHQTHYEAGIGYLGPRTGPIEYQRSYPVMRPTGGRTEVP